MPASRVGEPDKPASVGRAPPDGQPPAGFGATFFGGGTDRSKGETVVTPGFLSAFGFFASRPLRF